MLFAARRALVPTVPADMADDLTTPLAVVAAGHRLALAPGAEARLAAPESAARGFAGCVAAAEREWRALMQYRWLMDPRRTGAYGLQLIGRRLLPCCVALVLPVLFAASLATAGQGTVYMLALAAQFTLYGLAAAALVWDRARDLPGAAAARDLVAGQVATGLGVLRAMTGGRAARGVPARA